jgi:hypothetical protein
VQNFTLKRFKFEKSVDGVAGVVQRNNEKCTTMMRQTRSRSHSSASSVPQPTAPSPTGRSSVAISDEESKQEETTPAPRSARRKCLDRTNNV